MTLAAALVGIAVVTTGCSGEVTEPRPQWVVEVSTDAPVPQFGDRLFVEVLDADGAICGACRRQFHAAEPERWPFSFGVLPSDDERRVRVRLYRSSIVSADGTPAGDRLIDALFTLPETSSLSKVHVPLASRCFGVEARVAERMVCDPKTGELTPEAVVATEPASTLVAGSWPPAQPVPCTGDAPQSMVCVRGGAFLLGDALAPAVFEPTYFPMPERVVQLAPFWLDTTELTVGQFRALRQAHPELSEPAAKGQAGIEHSEHCTYDPADAGADQLPLNCLPASLAADICAAQQKRLPTEAEWELAAGNGAAESPYGWGSSDGICSKAIVARGGITMPSGCQIHDGGTLPAGPAAVASLEDVGELGIWDMSGNVAEWVADAFAAYDEPCWQGAPPLVNPSCTLSSLDAERSLRGGHWGSLEMRARVTLRESVSASASDPRIGLRCARSASAP